MSARPERKRMTNYNNPQLSGMDSANHCAAFPGLSALSTTTRYIHTRLPSKKICAAACTVRRGDQVSRPRFEQCVLRRHPERCPCHSATDRGDWVASTLLPARHNAECLFVGEAAHTNGQDGTSVKVPDRQSKQFWLPYWSCSPVDIALKIRRQSYNRAHDRICV
jgi:hypothetical protein